jgi:hypothetical protein
MLMSSGAGTFGIRNGFWEKRRRSPEEADRGDAAARSLADPPGLSRYRPVF